MASDPPVPLATLRDDLLEYIQDPMPWFSAYTAYMVLVLEAFIDE